MRGELYRVLAPRPSRGGRRPLQDLGLLQNQGDHLSVIMKGGKFYKKPLVTKRDEQELPTIVARNP